MRINARLDESRSRKLEFLSRATDLSTSDIVKQAIDVYYDQVRGQRPLPAEVLSNSGFIGCGETSPDLSERYKEAVRDFVAATVRGYEDTLRDPARSLTELLHANPGLPRALTAASLRAYLPLFDAGDGRG